MTNGRTFGAYHKQRVDTCYTVCFTWEWPWERSELSDPLVSNSFSNRAPCHLLEDVLTLWHRQDSNNRIDHNCIEEI